MCCFFLLFVLLGPRFAVLAIWIFGDRVELAFDGWLLPLLGLLFLPWTTLMYLLVWSFPGGVNGAEWIVVALGVVLDLATYSARSAQSRYSRSGYAG